MTNEINPSAKPAPDPDDRKALLDLELVYVRSNDTDGHGPIGIRGNEEAADLVLSAGFRRLTVTPDLVAGLRKDAGDYAKIAQGIPMSHDPEWDARNMRAWQAAEALEAALGDTK